MKTTKIKILKAENGEYYWAAFARNGKQIGKCSETHKRKRTVMQSIKLMEQIFSEHIVIDEAE